MLVEFNNQWTPQSAIEVNEPSNCAIECINLDGEYFYIFTKTTYGTITLVFFGPVIPDIQQLPDGYSTQLKRMEYKPDKVLKEIQSYMNDKKRKISEASEVDPTTVFDYFINLKDYIEDGGY